MGSHRLRGKDYSHWSDEMRQNRKGHGGREGVTERRDVGISFGFKKKLCSADLTSPDCPEESCAAHIIARVNLSE